MKHFIKRFICVIAVIAMILPTTVLAKAVVDPSVFPDETGVFFSDDYEVGSWDNYSSHFGPVSYVGTEKYGQSLNINMTEKSGIRLSTASLGIDSSTKYTIKEGQILVSQDVYVPSGTTLPGDDYGQIYCIIWAKTDAGEWFTNSGILYTVKTNYADGARIVFNKTNVSNCETDLSGYLEKIDYDRWYKIECVIDYDNCTVKHYLDGKHIGDLVGANLTTDVPKYGINEIYIDTQAISAGGSKPQIYFDNWKLERLGDDGMKGAISTYGDNYVDVKFNYTVDKENDISPDGTTLYAANGEFDATKAELIDADTIRYYFDTKITPTGSYLIELGKDVKPAIGNIYGKVYAGEQYSFIPKAFDTTSTLLENNFNNFNGITEAQSASYNKFVYLSGKESKSDNDFKEAPSETYKYVEALDDGNGGKMLGFKHNDTLPNNSKYKGLKFPFNGGASASSGVVTMEFDAGVYNVNDPEAQKVSIAHRALFGLNDTTRQENKFVHDTDMDDYTWSNSTVFAEIGYWYDNSKLFMSGSQKHRTLGIDYQTDEKSACNETDGRRVYNGTMHSYKVVADIDKNSFDIYMDGSMVKHNNYIPGDATGGTFNAFILSSVLTSGDTNAEIYLDNLKVTQLKRAVNIADIKYYGASGAEYKYSPVMPASVQKIDITFSEDMNVQTGDIVISGLDKSEYDVESEDDKATITIPNCLNPNETYKLIFDGNMETWMGAPLGRQIAINFASDGGGIEYLKPVLYKNGSVVSKKTGIVVGNTVTVKADVVNTKKDGIDCYLTLATYKDGYMTGIKSYNLIVPVGGEFMGTAEIEFTADEDFVNADEVRAFVFDNTLDLNLEADNTWN